MSLFQMYHKSLLDLGCLILHGTESKNTRRKTGMGSLIYNQLYGDFDVYSSITTIGLRKSLLNFI